MLEDQLQKLMSIHDPRLLLTILALLGAPALSAHPGAGIVVNAQGQVFFVHGNSIVRVDASGSAKVILEDAQHKNFYQLHHLFLDAQGNLYTAADTGSGIWKVTPDEQLSRFFPPPNEDRALLVGLGGDPFAIDRAGNIMAVNSRQNQFTQLLRVTPAGRITVLAGGAWGHADGLGEKAQFADLHGSAMVFGSDGVLYLTDNGSCIRKVTLTGMVSTLAGGTNRGYADGRAAQARFDAVAGLAFDAAGNVYASDYGNNRIRKVSPDGTTITFAGSGHAGSTDGPPAAATFAQPTGVTFGPDGILYVLEAHYPRIRKVATNGHVTTLLRSLPAK